MTPVMTVICLFYSSYSVVSIETPGFEMFPDFNLRQSECRENSGESNGMPCREIVWFVMRKIDFKNINIFLPRTRGKVC